MKILERILRKLFYVDYKSPMWFDNYLGWFDPLVEKLLELLEQKEVK